MNKVNPSSGVNPFQNLETNSYIESDNALLSLWDKIGTLVSFTLYPIVATHSWWYDKGKKPLPPQANGHFIIGSLPEHVNHNYEVLPFMSSYLKTYGHLGICKVNLGPKSFCIVADPVLIDIILKQPKNFVRGPSLDSWRVFSKNGLKEGDYTSEMRRNVDEAIGEKKYHIFFPAIIRASNHWLDRLDSLAQKGQPINLMYECGRASLAALGESFFKPEPNDTNPFNLSFENEEKCGKFLNSYHTLFQLISKRIISIVDNIPLVGKN
nr:hypothetical protein [Parachlamydiaceae bacterium]